ncbi:hypothetical protein [Streptomyces brevispora]|uniref:Calcium-binding protein n=1 Tax=Streptomyces brevispora TaxID=887462 RepID=A0A561V0G2_9ACTN|nr:hypothetical protein [Streptomyces brevispora]TWG05115.1 hypothetical protein FHX80_113591 [Streptomyces brevispora]WSC13846.1 hypothetical protein OIE64_13995 [Streptomyces brevispora]
MKAGSRTGAVTALAGALVLSAFTAPTAQAAGTGITVTGIVVNGGKPVVVGTTDVKEPRITFRIQLPAGLSTAKPAAWDVYPYLYHGGTAAKEWERNGFQGIYTCYEKTARISDCEGTLYIDPRYRLKSAKDATTWKIGVATQLWTANDHLKTEQFATAPGGVQIRRWAKATVNASPEPVKKGKTLTVTGSLKRADWAKHTYTGVAAATVKLQFRKKGSSAYSTVKTVTSSSTGALKTTVKASVDGYWRWSFGGWSTTGAATSPVDYVDVR